MLSKYMAWPYSYTHVHVLYVHASTCAITNTIVPHPASSGMLISFAMAFFFPAEKTVKSHIHMHVHVHVYMYNMARIKHTH